MIKKLLQKYQAYRDKKFLARLERVLNNNVIHAEMKIEGFLDVKGNIRYTTSE